MPIGVSILPRLAATVCITTTGTTSFSCPASRSTTSAKGTKVISETSLVTTMLQTNGRKTSTSIIPRLVRVWCSSPLPRNSNSPAFWNPFMTAIREKSIDRVSQSI